jgi:lipopolysaccharide export system permease protein
MDRTGSGERRIILAKNAGISDMGDGNLSISLDSAFVQSGKENVREDYDYASSDLLRYIVPQEEIIQTVYNVGPREMSSVDVKKEIKIKEETIRETLDIEKFRLAGRALRLEAFLRDKSGDQNSGEALASEYNSIAESVREIENDLSLRIYHLEYYKKFAIPFGALSFVLLAVSIGLMAKRSGQTVGFLIGIVIAAFYWAALLMGQAMGTDMGFSPFWSMWFPNALALITGSIFAFVRITT